MAGKSKNHGRYGKPGTPASSRLAREGGHDLFRRKRVRDLTWHQESGNNRGWKGVHPFHAGFALLMITFGLLSVSLVMLNMISNLWFASLMSMSGSMAVMAGVWMLYDAIKERKSVDNLVRDAIMRSLRDKN
ncbi:MAG: hypothetical protein EA363_01880 [Balneolaceae bacterium]|nr:MAG: hypothetical protein EA363_01880 [Balneolaceae bacterium]